MPELQSSSIPRNITRLVLGLYLALLLAAGCASPEKPAAAGIPISLEPCQLSTPGLPVRLPARCGTLPVYENRAARSGRQILLRVAVVPAIARDPEADPLFFLAGGPGQAATESYPQMSGAFNLVNRKRDIVLVDQRGTGASNRLECRGLEEGDNLSAYDDGTVAEAVSECLTRMDADPSLYTTPIAMEDLDQVRQALGYERINLYGVSYGTRAALNYTRQYPDRVRTAVLDGVWPTNLTLAPRVAQFAQRALDLIFRRCAADSACGPAFPNLRSEFEALVERLRQAPVRVTLAHPTTGKPTEVLLTYDRFASTIRLLSYAPETVALLPLLIHSAQTTGDLRALSAQALLVGQNLEDTMSEGMGLSVVCAEDVPFTTLEEVERVSKETYMGSSSARDLLRACSLWPRGAVSSDYTQPVTSSAPVLLLSGEADPVTPPANGELARASLSNSLHLVLSGQGHGQAFRGCVPRLMADFIESGSLSGLDTVCTRDIQPMPFFENPAGPGS